MIVETVTQGPAHFYRFSAAQTSSAVDGADLIPPPSGKTTQYLSIIASNGLAATWTAEQVLYLAFGMTANAKQGGFFPTGLNGKITMSGGPATDANLA
jgi:hypothetical protein